MPLELRNLAPSDVTGAATLWKYVRFEKFLDFLLMHRLYFRRVDKLDDPYECLLPPDATARALAGAGPEVAALVAEHQRYLKSERIKVFVCCWHLSDHESEAMWKLFGGAGHSIAITFRLSTFLAAIAGEELTAGKVIYKDLGRESLNMKDIFDFAMIKRKPFEHEKEFRALYINRDGPDSAKLLDAYGYYLPVEPTRLVDRIYVSPLSEKWQLELTETIAAQHGLKGKVVQSTLL